jgi:hypothetical protein
MRIIKALFFGFILLASILIVWINLKLYTENLDKKEKREDIICQLNFLNNELKHNNLGERMQKIFPEGFVFANVLYGLSWCELGLSAPLESTKTQALKEALFAYNQINTEQAKLIFDPALEPENGIFYIGWNNYLLSKILLLDSTFENHETYKKLYSKQCEQIATALQKSNTPFLETYKEASWPADMCVAMASISHHDKNFEPKYKNLIADWVAKVKAKLDPKTQMIPHRVDSESGETIEGARGCSTSLTLRLMAEIDPAFALEQYKLYKEKFVSTALGLPSIREYPKGQSGYGDIDSGPVILGVGFAGTIVSVSTFSVLGDPDLSENQYKTINAFGFSQKTSDTKKYIFGQLPIADAFIAWSRSSGLNYPENIKPASKYWRLKFHAISTLIVSLLWLLIYVKILPQKNKV